MSTLTLPGPKTLTEADETSLSEMISRIYQFCRSRQDGRVGQPYMTWRMDLRKRGFLVRGTARAGAEKLARWRFTPHMNARKEASAAEFEFEFADRSETYFVAEKVSFKGLQLYLTGNEFERTFPLETFAPVPDAEWDAWGRGVTAEICRHYEEFIYPRVVETLGRIGAMREGRPLCVVDLGGGAGQLAALVCEKLPQVAKVVLVDRSAALVEQARARAAKHPDRLVTRRADITAEGFDGGLDQPPDVVVLCGVVATQVMSHDDGLRLMRAVHDRLPPGGFAVVPSYSPALLAGDEYEALGFEVHNRSLSLIEATPAGSAVKTNDFYVVEKH